MKVRYWQIRWKSSDRMSMTKRVENMVKKDKTTFAKTTAEKAMKKQQKIATQSGRDQDEKFKIITAAWELVPERSKKESIQIGSPDVELNEIVSILNKTGALQKYLKDRKVETEAKESDTADGTVKMIVAGVLLFVIIGTALSIHNYNSLDGSNKRRAIRYPI